MPETSFFSPKDHHQRYASVNELHARPFPAIDVPMTAVFMAFKEPGDAASRDRDRDLAHLINLIDRHGGTHPRPDATHWSGSLGRMEVKWESHTEFVTYSAFEPHVSPRAFDPAQAQVFPADWLAATPGRRMTSILMRIEELPQDPEELDAKVNEWFVPESLAMSRVLDGAAVIAGDFRIDAAGHMRFVVFVRPGTGPRRIGRIVQRLCEIETYRAMSMLGLTLARKLTPELNNLDLRLSSLVSGLENFDTADTSRSPESTLHDLLSISAELERLAASSTFRFGATHAYEVIVNQRVQILREERATGRQTFNEFMMRRYDPAMRTVKSTERRLAALTERAARAAELLRTRVDVERSAQNQSLLESMDRRADLALRLQHTVEGLSVVAISYYALNLATYALYPLGKWLGLSKEILTAALVLPVLGLVWLGLRRIRRKIH